MGQRGEVEILGNFWGGNRIWLEKESLKREGREKFVFCSIKWGWFIKKLSMLDLKDF